MFRTVLLGLIYVFIVTSMLSIGFGLSLKDVIASLEKHWMLLRSVVINLVAIPAAAIFIAYLLGLSGAVLFGFLFMACAPGASYAPRITEFANGDVGHSTGLMFFLCTIAVFSAPFTLMLALPETYGIDPWPVIETLAVIQMIPLFLGMFIRSYRPLLGKKLSAPAFWASNISALVVVVVSLVIIFLSESNGGFFSQITGTLGVPAIILAVIISVFIGYFFGGENTGEKKSMAISSVNRNAGVAFLIAVSGMSMISEVVIMIIAYIIVQTLVSGGLAGYWLWKDLKAGKKTILSGDA
ncbi:BASS family bile acid:Na+ symporter [Methanomicrobium sp. W14]|uniref:bile acid:sodium symporter family protein n=1 Tax=Methanomicrobium sp. W14 TaxID=2817839 RepID=UPI001FDA38AD|nr:bile acid:sodium symporter [Methanomicrobium sp. W14]MBP2133067.1 BASS family bile acid:Na+ symporter [Methanomicrobium sp. W14]